MPILRNSADVASAFDAATQLGFRRACSIAFYRRTRLGGRGTGRLHGAVEGLDETAG
jgi:hypothetical protein